ncbi:MAG: alanine--tRNA ligase [Candidatus Paceibacterota bacterium]
MKSNDIRNTFLSFFKERGHSIIPSAPLVPENDSSVLFITAGMQPLVPYLLGQPHPEGKRLVGVQKCVRTQDIDEVGDATHDTFFEMLGNWSLGDYFKEDAIKWSHELLIHTFGLDPARLYITVFEGNDDAPKDSESIEIWKSLGIPENRIYEMSAETNWWSPGENGPCGPDSEMFYDITQDGLGDLSKEEFIQADEEQKVIEVWNDVFMEYEKKDGEVIGKLSQKNVDTGAGLERLVMVLQKKDNIFETDLFSPLMKKLVAEVENQDQYSMRIVADHIRTAAFMIIDGVSPSNSEQGYVLRRIIRRAVRHADTLGLPEDSLGNYIEPLEDIYRSVYPEIGEKAGEIQQEIQAEEERFRSTLAEGLREFEKLSDGDISGEDAFMLFSTYGFPLEETLELADEKGISVDVEGFKAAMKKHKELSRAGAEKKFKGGLADHSEMSVKYHTATHLLHAALRDILGDHVEQRGSNVTSERLRFDFTHPDSLSEEEKQQVESWINEKIEKGLSVSSEEMTVEEAQKRGALGLFEEKYGDRVMVYTIGDEDNPVSIEICGGPHVENTGELGEFKITSEKSSSAGVRRIKAILE